MRWDCRMRCFDDAGQLSALAGVAVVAGGVASSAAGRRCSLRRGRARSARRRPTMRRIGEALAATGPRFRQPARSRRTGAGDRRAGAPRRSSADRGAGQRPRRAAVGAPDRNPRCARADPRAAARRAGAQRSDALRGRSRPASGSRRSNARAAGCIIWWRWTGRGWSRNSRSWRRPNGIFIRAGRWRARCSTSRCALTTPTARASRGWSRRSIPASPSASTIAEAADA